MQRQLALEAIQLRLIFPLVRLRHRLECFAQHAKPGRDLSPVSIPLGQLCQKTCLINPCSRGPEGRQAPAHLANARLDVALERAQVHGQKVVNRAFFLATALVVIIFGLSLAKVLIQRRLGPATK